MHPRVEIFSRLLHQARDNPGHASMGLNAAAAPENDDFALAQRDSRTGAQRSARRLLMVTTPAHHGAVNRNRHAANTAAMRVCVFARHTRDPSRCRAKPTCRLTLWGTACRAFYLALCLRSSHPLPARLRLSTSRAQGAQRSLEGRAGAAFAARWRRPPCTLGCSRSTISAVGRRHCCRKARRYMGARTGHPRTTARTQTHRAPTSTTVARCRAQPTRR